MVSIFSTLLSAVAKYLTIGICERTDLFWYTVRGVHLIMVGKACWQKQEASLSHCGKCQQTDREWTVGSCDKTSRKAPNDLLPPIRLNFIKGPNPHKQPLHLESKWSNNKECLGGTLRIQATSASNHKECSDGRNRVNLQR